MFREAWRLQRDQFWSPDMSGLDWQGVLDRYLPLVDRAATRAEFSDLMWEMQGELAPRTATSWAETTGRSRAGIRGFLGADLEFEPRKGVWRIVRIPRGDSWDEKRSSALAAPGLGVEEGDAIIEVAGQGVDRNISPYERLVNLAGREVQLTIRKREGAARTITVKTLKEEYSLRYRDWVETNRALVHKRTQGRVGYVHIPNMGPVGYAEFHRYYMSEVRHEGLMVDVRYNGGRPRLPAAAGETAPQADRLRQEPLWFSRALSAGRSHGSHGRADQRICRVRRRPSSAMPSSSAGWDR